MLSFIYRSKSWQCFNKSLEYFNHNVGGTLSLCNAMARAGLFLIVFSPSATVFDLASLGYLSNKAHVYTWNLDTGVGYCFLEIVSTLNVYQGNA